MSTQTTSYNYTITNIVIPDPVNKPASVGAIITLLILFILIIALISYVFIPFRIRDSLIRDDAEEVELGTMNRRQTFYSWYNTLGAEEQK